MEQQDLTKILLYILTFIVLTCGVLLYQSATKYKEIEGHKYIRTGAYNYSHSHECWCKDHE